MANLRSTQIAKIVDLWSEGEIEGLVAGAQSIYFDETPVQNEDGTFNFEGVKFEQRLGTNDQISMPGYNSVENEIAVGTKVVQATPVTRSLTNVEADRVRVTISLPALYYQDAESGNLLNQTATLKLSISDNGGPFVDQRVGTTTSTLKNLSGLTANTVIACEGFTVNINFSFQSAQYVGFGIYTGGNGFWKGNVEYRKVGDPTWIVLSTLQVSDNQAVARQNTFIGIQQDTNKYASRSVKTGELASGIYEIRLVTISSGRATVGLANIVRSVAQYEMIISGSTQSKYLRSWELDLPGNGPWNIRVTRLTADNTSQYVQNDTYFESMTEIIDAKLRYPNSAYIAVELDAQRFDNIPSRGYDVKLLKVQVPTNYDPVTKVYSGIWDGTFKIEWTDNPAWCFYDLCTNSRYGLGEYLNIGQIDKWALYTIAQYCDELIGDGFGSVEPRFTCNIYIQSREEAFRVIQDMASIFRAMTYWDSGALTLAQDSPSDPVHLFTNSNVEGGSFTYSGSAAKARHTVVIVTWNDPNDLYRQKVEYVEDEEAIARFGIIETEVVAMGCTSRGQANRVGRWLLYAERYEADTVTFVTGLEGIVARPGAIIKVADTNRAGTRLGGRVGSATVNTIIVDSPLSLPAGTYDLMVMLPDGTAESRPVSSVVGDTIAVFPAFTSAPQSQAQWLITGAAIEAQTFRIISVQEQEDLKIQITALKHDSNKYAYVEDNLALQPRVTTLINGVPTTPANVIITEALYATKSDVLNRVTLSWDLVESASRYSVVYSVDDNNNITLPDTTINSIDLLDAPTGTYVVKVYAIGPLGSVNEVPGEATAIVVGKTAPPSDVTNFVNVLDPFIGLTLYWDKVADVDIAFYEVRVGTSFDSGASLGQVKANNLPIGLLPVGTQTYWVKALDTTGNYSLNAATQVVTIVSAEAPTVSSVFAGDSIVLSWTAEQGSLATQAYEIRYGASWATGTVLGQIKGTTTALKAQWSGNRTFYVAAIDANNNYGAAGQVTATIVVPSSVTVTSEVVDNNVLLRWGDATGTLPIDYYEIRRGATYAGGAVIGRVSARFTAIFESVGGTLTYWLQPVDVAGNAGALSSISAQVSSPPDYQLLYNLDSTFTGTKTNFVYDADAGGHVTPMNATETYQQHFTTNGYTVPQDQVTAGYPYYAQPIGVNGSYEETIDYGTVVPATKITTTLTYTTIAGTVTVTPTISYKKLVGDPWTNITGQDSVFVTDFRYVKIKYDFVRSNASSFVLVTGLNVKFDVKLRNDAGTATVNAADTGGTVVNFNVPFLDVSSITVTPLATVPRTAVYDFVDVANPTSFKILLYDNTGTRVNGTVGWSVKGV